MEKFTTERIDAKTPTGIAEHTDKYPVPAGEDPNQYFQAGELNTINSKINQNTQDVKDLMLLGNELVGETLKKIDNAHHSATESGESVFITVGEYGKGDILLTNEALISISGIKVQGLTGTYILPHLGKRYQIINKTGHDVILLNNQTAEHPNYGIKNIKQESITLPNDNVIEYVWYPDGFYERFKTWEINSDFNRILVNNGFVKTTTDFTLLANASWLINGVPYTNTANATEIVPLSASGNHRLERIVLNTSNTIERVAGDEVPLSEEPAAPPVPPNTIEYSFYRVTDTEIEEPEIPIIGTEYVKKVYSAVVATNSVPLSQDPANFRVQVDVKAGRSHHQLNHPSITGIVGFYLNTAYGEQPYIGKLFVLHNFTGNPVALYHEDYVNNPVAGCQNVALWLREGSNIVMPERHTAVFEWAKKSSGWTLVEIARSWSDNVIKSGQLLIFQADGNTTTNIKNIQENDQVIGFVEGTFLNAATYVSGDPLTLAAYEL